MTFQPIVERELRVTARRISPAFTGIVSSDACRARGDSSAGMGFLSVWGFRRAAVGRMAYNVLSYLALAVCLLEGVRQTADCVSEEKREGTLGLLFLTDLKGL